MLYETTSERLFAGLNRRLAYLRGCEHLERPASFGDVTKEVAGVAAIHDREYICLYGFQERFLGLVPDHPWTGIRLISTSSISQR